MNILGIRWSQFQKSLLIEQFKSYFCHDFLKIVYFGNA